MLIITGDNADNTLIYRNTYIVKGLGGNDRLSGGMMYGGTGDDTYTVDHANDQVIELENEGSADWVISEIFDYTLPNHVEDLSLYKTTGSEGRGNATIGRGNSLDNDIVGNELANTLYGFAGNDVLRGMPISLSNAADPVDQLIGGLGDDSYVVNFTADGMSDQVIEQAGEGIDSVLAYYSYTLPSHVENLALLFGIGDPTGNQLDNTIQVGGGKFDPNASNTLRGLGGNDHLSSYKGNDNLLGGAGNDTLLGGAHNDMLIGYGGAAGTRTTETDQLHGEEGTDTFVLGDRQGVFYLGDGVAYVNDFYRGSNDKLQVFGNASDYSFDYRQNIVGSRAPDTQIFYKGDRIAIVKDTTEVSMPFDFVFAR